MAVIILVIFGGAFYVKKFLPDVGDAPDLKIVSTPEKVARGKYLANNVMLCTDCHSNREWNYYAGPVKPGTLGKGGDVFDNKEGFPGTIYAPNITPAGLSQWTDGEIFRAITTGVKKDGAPIFPIMPHDNYGLLDTEDIESVISYLRTLPAIPNTIPESNYEFPMSFIIHTIPKKATFSKRPDENNSVAKGKYLITAASCGHCHTPFDKGTFDMALKYAGGRKFATPVGTLSTPNITPDKETGIGNWSKEVFVDKFRVYRDSAYAHRPLNIEKEIMTMMPWSDYAGMTDADLGSIYDYLFSLKPIKHSIVKLQK